MIKKALKTISDPSRLHIVEFLSQKCCRTAAVDEDGGVYEGPTASEVCCHLTGVDKINSTISHHLHELEAAGLVRIERKGKKMICTLRPEGVEELADYLRAIAKGELITDCCTQQENNPSSCCDPKSNCC